MDDNKRQDELKLRLTEREYHALAVLAAFNNRTISDIGHLVLRQYLFGHSVARAHEQEGPNGDAEGRV